MIILSQAIIQLRVVNIMICLSAGNHGDWMEKAHVNSLYQYCNILIGLNISTPLPSWQHDCPTLSCSCDHIDILVISCKHYMMQGEVIVSNDVIVRSCDLTGIKSF